ncbi:MAG TPA: hypothetical protein VF918_15590 [Anaerolineales bacterium]
MDSEQRLAGVTRPEQLTLAAYILIVILAGANAVAVRFTVMELPPFWSATLRFAAAALIFWILFCSANLHFPSVAHSSAFFFMVFLVSGPVMHLSTGVSKVSLLGSHKLFWLWFLFLLSLLPFFMESNPFAGAGCSEVDSLSLELHGHFSINLAKIFHSLPCLQSCGSGLYCRINSGD